MLKTNEHPALLPNVPLAPPAGSEELRVLREAASLAESGIAQFARDGTFLRANDRFCEMLGYAQDDLLGRTFQEISYPDDLPRCLALVADLDAGRIPRFVHEKRFIRGDGSITWTRVTVSALRDADGRAESFVGIAVDVTEQHDGRAHRWEAEERLRIALEASSTGIFHWDMRADTLHWDENLDRLFGLEPAASPRTFEQFLALVHADDRARLEAACRRCAIEGGGFEEELRTDWPDGSSHWLCGKGRSYRDAEGTPCYLTGAATDITARVVHEQAERAARATAERAIRARDEVLAVVAHDLRNPVHTIMMSASAMLDIPLDEERRAQQLGVIVRAATGMNHLIRDLVVAARIDAGTFEIKPLPIPVPALLEETLELFEMQARHRSITIGCNVAGDIAPMIGDRDRVLQVLSNIVGNALKFTQREGAVAIHARERDGMIEVATADTGMGIAAEQLPHIFDRFWQADRRKGAGAGLGLAIAKGIVEAHGGRIWAESEVGRGTTFHFTIPAAPAGPAAPATR